MKIFSALFASKKGFTMIELLVVISVIGILAVAVLSSINPIEQINKGRDTRVRTDAAQLINAVDRYFSIHETYPWNDTNGTDWTGTGTYDAAFMSTGGSAAAWGWAQILADTDEVKSGFVNRLINDDEVDVYKAGTGNATMYGCFTPSSKAFQIEAAKSCQDGTTPTTLGFTTCVTTDGTTDVDNMICLP